MDRMYGKSEKKLQRKNYVIVCQESGKRKKEPLTSHYITLLVVMGHHDGMRRKFLLVIEKQRLNLLEEEKTFSDLTEWRQRQRERTILEMEQKS